MKELDCETHSTRTVAEPSPTGKAFFKWIDKFKKRHPETVGVPLKLQDQYWIRAAQDTGADDLLGVINAVRENKGLKKVK